MAPAQSTRNTGPGKGCQSSRPRRPPQRVRLQLIDISQNHDLDLDSFEHSPILNCLRSSACSVVPCIDNSSLPLYCLPAPHYPAIECFIPPAFPLNATSLWDIAIHKTRRWSIQTCSPALYSLIQFIQLLTLAQLLCHHVQPTRSSRENRAFALPPRALPLDPFLPAA